jgi:hypothetical protein
MPRAKCNARKTVDDVVQAFLDGRSKSTGSVRGRGYRYSTDGTRIKIWGNVVAEKAQSGIFLTDAGWHSVITKQMLNTILDEMHNRGITRFRWSISQSQFEWYIDGSPWPGKVRIGNDGELYDATNGQLITGEALHTGRRRFAGRRRQREAFAVPRTPPTMFNPPSKIKQIQRVVLTGKAKKFNGTIIDPFMANVILQYYEMFDKANKKWLARMPIKKMVSEIGKLHKSFTAVVAPRWRPPKWRHPKGQKKNPAKKKYHFYGPRGGYLGSTTETLAEIKKVFDPEFFYSVKGSAIEVHGRKSKRRKTKRNPVARFGANWKPEMARKEYRGVYLGSAYKMKMRNLPGKPWHTYYVIAVDGDGIGFSSIHPSDIQYQAEHFTMGWQEFFKELRKDIVLHGRSKKNARKNPKRVRFNLAKPSEERRALRFLQTMYRKARLALRRGHVRDFDRHLGRIQGVMIVASYEDPPAHRVQDSASRILSSLMQKAHRRR